MRLLSCCRAYGDIHGALPLASVRNKSYCISRKCAGNIFSVQRNYGHFIFIQIEESGISVNQGFCLSFFLPESCHFYPAVRNKRIWSPRTEPCICNGTSHLPFGFPHSAIFCPSCLSSFHSSYRTPFLSSFDKKASIRHFYFTIAKPICHEKGTLNSA